MDVSLIICTRNRCLQLARCLHHVQDIAFDRPWELIIVDNGSTDETASSVQEFIKISSILTVYVLETKLGKSNGLNAALGIARGTILAFTDDDCYPAPDFLVRTWAAFEDASVGYITGRITLHDPTDIPITINESTTPRVIPKKSYMPTGLVHGANMAFRKCVLVRIGGFDPLFGPGMLFFAGEDIDVASRANAMGWTGKYCPEVVVRHHHGRKTSDAPRLWKSYAIGRGAYHMKLLLCGQFLWFAQAIYQLRWRYRLSRRTILWEQVGAAQYIYVLFSQYFQKWLRKVLMNDLRHKRNSR